jgi:hypothetical protein
LHVEQQQLESGFLLVMFHILDVLLVLILLHRFKLKMLTKQKTIELK